MINQLDSLETLTKHPSSEIYWGFEVPLQTEETIQGTITPTIYPSGSDYNLEITDVTYSGSQVSLKVSGGKYGEHYIAEFPISTLQGSRTRKRVFQLPIAIV